MTRLALLSLLLLLTGCAHAPKPRACGNGGLLWS